MKSALFLVFIGLFCLTYHSNVDKLRLNQIQVIGSHNSYKQAIDPALFQRLRMLDSNMVKEIDYSHIGLSAQLDMGLMSLEIDVYADTKGKKYAQPKGLEWAGKNSVAPAYDPKGEMNEPGFKVLHIQEIDFRSNCLTFKNCLEELKTWSNAHKNHLPIFITMNAKDEEIKRPGFTVPEKFDAAVFDELDKTLQTYLGIEKLITPDVVRGNYPTLETAVLAGNWPSIKKARGKFLFVLDEGGEKRATYLAGHPSLKGRMMFSTTEAGAPEAAFLIKNNPIEAQKEIQELVKKGYIVRTRADSGTLQARKNDKSQFEAACTSNAQIISTDYYLPSTHFRSDYAIQFNDKTFCRPNPVLKR
jgi:hypothetical protein